MSANIRKILFFINPGAGKGNVDWPSEIDRHFLNKEFEIEKFEMTDPCDDKQISDVIGSSNADMIVAVGGDGTLKLVAEHVKGTDIILGMLPAGSANGMAKELNIPVEPEQALKLLTEGKPRKIHLVKINDQTCIHLSDLGFNAYVVKKFEAAKERGMWTYVKSAWKVLWSHNKMIIKIQTDDGIINREAAMLVIANATRYGTGVVINPNGRLDDELFEVIIVKKISFSEIFKMRFLNKDFDKRKTELLQTKSLSINSKRKMHFQVDGEYLGKINEVKAELIPHALNIMAAEELLSDKNQKL